MFIPRKVVELKIVYDPGYFRMIYPKIPGILANSFKKAPVYQEYKRYGKNQVS